MKERNGELMRFVAAKTFMCGDKAVTLKDPIVASVIKTGPYQHILFDPLKIDFLTLEDPVSDLEEIVWYYYRSYYSQPDSKLFGLALDHKRWFENNIESVTPIDGGKAWGE